MTAKSAKRPTPAKQAKRPAKHSGNCLAASKKSTPGKNGSTLDLAALELAYRTTGATLEVLGKASGISKGRVSQLATEHGWVRDLQANVRARADAKVQAQEAHDANVEAGTDAAVDHGATLMANTILRERKDVARLLRLADSLAGELDTQIGKANAKPGEPGGEVGVKVEPLAVRIDNLRKLSETTKNLMVLERHILNITPDTPVDSSRRVAEAVDNGFAGLKAAFDKKLGRA